METLKNLAVAFHDGDEHIRTVDGQTAESAAKAARIWLMAGEDREVFVSDGWDTMGPLEKGVTGDDIVAWFEGLESYRETQVSWDADEDPIYDQYDDGEDFEYYRNMQYNDLD